MISTATLTPPPHFDTPTYLMCSPQWYDVDYVINPWMAGNLHRPSRDVAFAQWRELHAQLQRVADVRLIPAVPGSPDMVFVGHAALVQHGIAAVSSFAHPQRQIEEAPLRRWLEEHGFLLWETPRETAFEGEGDAIFSADGGHLWAAHGVRTCRHSHRHVADAWHVGVTSLHLVDPRFYHLDTCFATLEGGFVLYFPEAFDARSLAEIEAAYPAEKRIVVTEAEATAFACNVIEIGKTILMGKVPTNLGERLERLGFKVIQIDLSEFLRGGGSAKSLALRLSDRSLASRIAA
ncbi:MAG TPA: arginine deiminase-related protein [Granulicella sp.]|nr:arginine deiminase-related protein [Granulicella sp.]